MASNQFSYEQLRKITDEGGLYADLALDIHFFARQNLLLVMKEICMQHFKEIWVDNLEYRIWEALSEGPKKLTLKNVNDLQNVYKVANGWWVKPENEYIFLNAPVWKEWYDEWKSQKKAQNT